MPIIYELNEIIKNFCDQLIVKKLLPEGFACPKCPLKEIPESVNFGDVSTDILFVLKKFSTLDVEKLSSILIDYCKRHSNIIEDIHYIPPGYINFTITDSKKYEEIYKLLSLKEKYYSQEENENKKVLIEYLSANPTGPLHIGHGRGAVLGDTLSRLYRFLGYNVTSEYYINDVGNQIEILGLSVKSKIYEKYNIEMPVEERKIVATEGYKGDYIKDVAERIISSIENISSIQSVSNDFYFKKAQEIILENIKNTVKRLGVSFDCWIRESFLYKEGLVDEVLSKLEKAGYLYRADGAVMFKSTAFNDEKDRVVIRSDSRTTYFASDIAYHHYKFSRGYNKLINFWGSDHHGYVNRIKAAVKALGHDCESLIIILYQLVHIIKDGVRVSMSTRKGEFITLEEVIDEVGVDACRYFLLTRAPNTHIDFDLSLAKKQSSENPVYYIQYAHTRICSILREAEKYNFPTDCVNAKFSLLDKKEEKKLINNIIMFPKVLYTSVENNSTHFLSSYLLSLAKDFHQYYESYRVLQENDRELSLARLLLVRGVKEVLRIGLSILSISAPERM
jgi:arginyl-tRNA synthetase